MAQYKNKWKTPAFILLPNCSIESGTFSTGVERVRDCNGIVSTVISFFAIAVINSCITNSENGNYVCVGINSLTGYISLGSS